MTFQIAGLYACTLKEFWDVMFFDEAYNEALYMQGLKFERYELLTLNEEADGSLLRRIKVTPKLIMPKPVKRLLGDSLTYIEEGRYRDGHFVTRIIPSRLADRITLISDMWLEPAGHGQSVRKVSVDVDIRVFGLSRIFEMFIERTLRDSYDKATIFSNQWASRA